MAKKKASEAKTEIKGKSPALQVHAGLTQFETKTVALSEETARAIARLQSGGGKGAAKPTASDVVFARAMPLLGKKLKIKGPGKRVEMELNLPLAIWRFIEALESENGCDQDAVLARIIEGK
jgi:hypothetical protein